MRRCLLVLLLLAAPSLRAQAPAPRVSLGFALPSSDTAALDRWWRRAAREAAGR